MADSMDNQLEQGQAATGLYGLDSLTDEKQTMNQIIAHVDCDCFYASCEKRRRPILAEEPVIVGMGYEHGKTMGAVATASYEARKYGIESAMAIKEALKLLPPASVVPQPGAQSWSEVSSEFAEKDNQIGFYCPVDMGFYEEVGNNVKEILQKYATVVEPISIDEAYLDITSETDWKTVESYVKQLKSEIIDKVDIPISIGVAPTKSAAKVASDKEKPNGLVVVPPKSITSFFQPIPVEQIHGIGPVGAETLREMGIETGGDLATADPHKLEQELGTKGLEAHKRARGYDPRSVSEPDDPKSISNEMSLGMKTANMSRKKNTIEELLDQVMERVNDKDVLYQTVGLKIVEQPFSVHTREHTLTGPINDYELTKDILFQLVTEFSETNIQKIGVKVSNLSFTGTTQPSLDSWKSKGSTNTDQPKNRNPNANKIHETDAEEHQTKITEFSGNKSKNNIQK